MVMNFFHSYRCISSHMILEAYPKKCVRQNNGHTPLLKKARKRHYPSLSPIPTKFKDGMGVRMGSGRSPCFIVFKRWSMTGTNLKSLFQFFAC